MSFYRYYPTFESSKDLIVVFRSIGPQRPSFAMQTTDRMTQAWLGAIEAEIQAHLYNHDACLQALNDMERTIGDSPPHDISYLFEFNPVLLLGYKGVCLQQFYQRQVPSTHPLLQEAKEALELALASEAPLVRSVEPR